MSTRKITLVLGAGVNKDINSTIGIGSELIRDISDRVTDRTSPDAPYLSKALMEVLNISESDRSSFCHHLDQYRLSTPCPSIDAFLNEIECFPEFASQRETFLTIGKVMIIAHILGYEGTTTRERIQKEAEGTDTRTTWLSSLAAYLKNNDLLTDSAEDSLKIVTFNYDRILERFLVYKFNSRAKDFVKDNITHAYGRVGYFDGIDPQNDEKKIDFEHNNGDLEKIEGIKDQIALIYSIRNRNRSGLREIVQRSHTVLVMGYGFDPMNNELLGLHNIGHGSRLVVAVYPRTDFPTRRAYIQHIRSTNPDAEIKVQTLKDFLEAELQTLNK